MELIMYKTETVRLFYLVRACQPRTEVTDVMQFTVYFLSFEVLELSYYLEVMRFSVDGHISHHASEPVEELSSSAGNKTTQPWEAQVVYFTNASGAQESKGHTYSSGLREYSRTALVEEALLNKSSEVC